MTQVQTLLLAVASAALACLVSPSTGSTFAAPERLATSISQASDSLGSCSRSSCLLDLEGPITQRTYLAIAELIGRRSPNQVVEIHLNSLGGDLEAAVRIGRLLRSNAPVRATVLPSAVCASACVFALVGATTRLIGGSVAVHRPYTVDSRSRSHSDLQGQFAQLDEKARQYLIDMNIAPSLYDEMLRYPPETLHTLSAEELARFRVSGNDYVWEEGMQRKHAEHLGIDRKTYLRRLGTADRQCTTPSAQGTRETTSEWAARLVASQECRNRILRTGR